MDFNLVDLQLQLCTWNQTNKTKNSQNNNNKNTITGINNCLTYKQQVKAVEETLLFFSLCP